MKYLFLILALLSFPTFGCPALHQEGLSDKQIKILQKAYHYGHPHSLGLTLAAIAWQESNGGMYLLNLQDPSVGVFQVNVDKVVDHLGYKNNTFNRNKAAQIGMTDFSISAKIAVKELQYWNIKRKRSWYDAVASYNAGNNFRNGYNYADDITQKVLILKLCEWR